MTPREPRRLETGDWVRVRGDDPSLRGVGKLIDGDFAAEDDALTACEVEVGARRVWISPADLTRITPDEEARLCEVALDRGLVPAEKRARLDDALRERAAGKRAVIRTPGLVDLLWATSTLADPTHGSGAVTAFLTEEALAALPAEPEPTPAAPPSPRPSPVLSVGLAAVLVPLDRPALVGLAARCRVDLGPSPETLDALAVQRRIVAAGVTAGDAVAALDPRHQAGWVFDHALDLLTPHALAGLGHALGIPTTTKMKERRKELLKLPPAATLPPALALLNPQQLQLLCERLGMERLAYLDTGDQRARIASVAGLASERPV